MEMKNLILLTGYIKLLISISLSKNKKLLEIALVLF